MLEDRASRLELRCVSIEASKLARGGKACLGWTIVT